MTDHEKDREAVEWLEWAIARHEEILRITRGGPVAVDLREDVAHEQRILTLAREALATRERGGDREAVEAELARALAKFPTWPIDPLHALAVLGEEFGEVTKAMLQYTYEPHKGVTLEDIRKEAIQTAAMAMRLVIGLPYYEYRRAHPIIPLYAGDPVEVGDGE